MPKEYRIRYAKIETEEFYKKYVDLPLGVERCSSCRHFGKVWSCPVFDFDIEKYWKKYKYLHLLGFILDLTDEEKAIQFSDEEFFNGVDRFYMIEKKKITDLQYEILDDNKDTIALGGGRCQLCDECTKEKGEKCRFPDKLMYSIESLGGKVTEITKDLLNIDIVWCKDNRLPIFITSVVGFLSDSVDMELKRIEKYMEEVK